MTGDIKGRAADNLVCAAENIEQNLTENDDV
jgi:hypothetical protein